MRKALLFVYILIFTVVSSTAQTPTFGYVDNYVQSAIENGYFPGAQLIIGNSQGVIYSNVYGHLDYSMHTPVSDSTIYDLASCTKVLATTLAVMKLYDDDKINLRAKVKDILEGADTLAYSDERVENLLYHTSGFAPVVAVLQSLVESKDESIPLMSTKKSTIHPFDFDGLYFAAKDVRYNATFVDAENAGVELSPGEYIDPSYILHLDSLVNAAYDPKQHGIHRYSDLNFYTLKKIVEQISGETIESFVGEIYDYMELKNIGYTPMTWSGIERIAPTEYDPLLRRDTVRGVVHDEMTYVIGGIGGAAGLFATAHDVAQICGMFLRGGVDYNGKRVISESTIDKFTRNRRFRSGAVHALGFDKCNPQKTPYTEQSFGHTGFTGTYLWCDPQCDMYVILLTNRVHPTRTNRQLNGGWRGRLWQICDSLSMANALCVEF
ncbi:MAG: serine hydrolase domain-containing protein [Rikenellaceae bacterium]